MSADLLTRLEAFRIDDGSPSFTFTLRLARENGWTAAYAARVVREYKRFVYLAATAADVPATPSVDVDQAWHLHLSYTRSYWSRMCDGVLGRPLHHNPTAGGADEDAKYRRQYQHTLDRYREAFGEEPPADVWPDVATRFGPGQELRTVSVDRVWVVPKRLVARIAVVAASVAALVVLTGCAGSFDPFDLVGVQFLAVLVPAMIVALILGGVLVWRSRGPDPVSEPESLADWQRLAFLKGGADRLAMAAVARLWDAGLVRVKEDGSGLERTDRVASWSLAVTETAALNRLPFKPAGREWASVSSAVAMAFNEGEKALHAGGYLLTPGGRFGLWCLFLAPFAAVIAGLGIPRLMAGMQNHKPVGFLIGSMLLGTVAALLASIAAGSIRLTRRGDGLLAAARKAGARLKVADDRQAGDDLGLAVALFGTLAMPVVMTTALRAWRPAMSLSADGGDGGDAGGCGGDGGGGGCGGGGCGGCGGGGD